VNEKMPWDEKMELNRRDNQRRILAGISDESAWRKVVLNSNQTNSMAKMPI
jgi:hypothetical protein